MSKLNIALIGAGRRGAGAHLPVIAKLTDVYNLVAICDMDESTAKSMSVNSIMTITAANIVKINFPFCRSVRS